jgi:putative FmdB family regulatory protein
MPTYDYRCRKCKHRFELFHGIKDDAVRKCPRCGARAERVPAGGAGILFKGSGFYITDYRSKAYKESAKADRGGSEGKGSGGSEAKPAGGSEGKATGASSHGSKGSSPKGSGGRARGSGSGSDA